MLTPQVLPRMQSVFGVSQASQQAAQKELSDMLLLRVPSDGQFAYHVARDRCRIRLCLCRT
jgi:hypothetical protein